MNVFFNFKVHALSSEAGLPEQIPKSQGYRHLNSIGRKLNAESQSGTKSNIPTANLHHYVSCTHEVIFSFLTRANANQLD